MPLDPFKSCISKAKKYSTNPRTVANRSSELQKDGSGRMGDWELYGASDGRIWDILEIKLQIDTNPIVKIAIWLSFLIYLWPRFSLASTPQARDHRHFVTQTKNVEIQACLISGHFYFSLALDFVGIGLEIW